MKMSSWEMMSLMFYSGGSIMFYFLFLGMVVLSESKILGLLNMSIGVSKSCFKGLYQFILDMFKLTFKNSVSMSLNQQSLNFFFLLALIQGLTVLTFLVLPFGVGNFIEYGYMWVLVMNMVITVLKLILINGFPSSFLKFLSVSMGEVSLLLEMLFISSYIFFIFLYVGLGICFWGESFNVFNFMSLFGMIPFTIILFMTLLLKSSSMPFDYLEAESEFVGGVGLEFYGVFFAIWTSMEYGLLINSSLLLSVCMLGMVVDYSMLFTLVVMCGILMMTVSSGILVSFQVKSIYGLLVSVFLALFTCTFLFLIMFSTVLCFCH